MPAGRSPTSLMAPTTRSRRSSKQESAGALWSFSCESSPSLAAVLSRKSCRIAWQTVQGQIKPE